MFFRPDWFLVRSKFVHGQTNDLFTDKNYLQACYLLINNFTLVSEKSQELSCGLDNSPWTFQRFVHVHVLRPERCVT